MDNYINIKDDRYSRLDTISWWDRDLLSRSKVLVVGCGALGNEIIKNLAMLGVGNIYVVDMDKVEKSNLTRSILFKREDEGQSKAFVAAKRAGEINDEIRIKYYDGSIFELGLGIFKDMDIVICGLDNREARLFVNQSCWKVTTPWVDGAIEILNGVARMFIPPDGVDYESTMTETDYRLLNHRKSCMLLGIDEIEQGKTPTTPTIASVIGGIEVQEAIKYLHNREDLLVLAGKGFIFNGNTNDSYTIEYQVKEDCNSRYTFGDIEKLDMGFEEVRLKDIEEFGKQIFDGDFNIDFNNEVVYGLYDEETKSTKDFYRNMNLLNTSDIKDGEKLLKPITFHTINTSSELFLELSGKKIADLKVPANDILILRKGNQETYIEFVPIDVFKNPKG